VHSDAGWVIERRGVWKILCDAYGMFEMKECQKNIYRDLLDETDWVGVEEVHPHGLDMFVLCFGCPFVF